MKRTATLLALLVSFISTAPLAQEREAILAAMNAEMERSTSALKIDDYEAPYFISYRIVDVTKTQLYASFGDW